MGAFVQRASKFMRTSTLFRKSGALIAPIQSADGSTGDKGSVERHGTGSQVFANEDQRGATLLEAEATRPADHALGATIERHAVPPPHQKGMCAKSLVQRQSSGNNECHKSDGGAVAITAVSGPSIQTAESE